MIGYPTNHLLLVFDDPARARAFLDAGDLAQAGAGARNLPTICGADVDQAARPAA